MEQNICRICTKSAGKNSQELFNRKHKILLRQILEITGVVLKNTKYLPQNICKQCHIDLEEAYEFRDRCINAQKYFTSTKYSAKGKRTKAKHDTEDDVEQTEFLHAVKDENEFLSEIQLKCEPLNDIDEDSIDGNGNDGFNLMEECYDMEEHSKTVACDGIDIELLKTTWEEEEPGEVTQQIDAKAKDISLIQDEAKTAANNKKTVSTKRKLISHKKKIERKNEFICDQCGNHFTCRHHFRTHLRRHIGDKRFRCEVCPNEFYTNSELKRHMRRHTGERPFACKHCDRRFSDYSTRIKHERTHTNERPFACNQCGKAFTTTYILKNHMSVHTGERPFRCTICNSSFTRQTHLTVHYRSITHKQNLEKQDMLKHQNGVASRNLSATIKNEFICDQCGNHFTCRHHFRTHLRRHIGDKRFRCEVCPNEFYTNSELKRHMRRHTGERPFACKHCDRRFSDYSTRIKHERTHTNERPFACNQCGKAFTTTYILKNHMSVHTGERPFRCTICNSSFTRQTHLTVHYRSITHKQNLEKQDMLKHQNGVASRNLSATM